MKTKIIGIEYTPKISLRYYVVFDFLGRERRTMVTPKIEQYHGIDRFRVGDTINVIRQFKNGKEFFFITGVEK